MTHLKKIGIFGGSFDPIHMGHINIAQSAYQEFGLDEVWFVPAGHSPNKEESKMTPAEMRKDLPSGKFLISRSVILNLLPGRKVIPIAHWKN